MTGCQNRSRACHSRGCRDEGCVEAKRRYNRRLAKLNRLGRGLLVDADRSRRQVGWLHGQGMSYRRIADAAGLTPQGLQKITGCGQVPASKVRRTTEQALLAVRPSRSGRAPVDATGTRRRLRALVRIGWTQQQLADFLAVEAKEVSRMMRAAERVSKARAARVSAVYDRVWMTFPTGESAARSRARAVRLGWVSPLAWEGVDIDDPQARPDTGGKRVRRRVSRPPAAEGTAA